jgi:flagellar motor switch/type III secretory pathway protein FliN
MNQSSEDIQSQRTKIVAQLAELSSLLGMIPSDITIEVHAPLGEKVMILSDWLSATRGSFLELSLLISKELDIQLQ